MTIQIPIGIRHNTHPNGPSKKRSSVTAASVYLIALSKCFFMVAVVLNSSPNVRDHRPLAVARLMAGSDSDQASGVTRVVVRCIALLAVYFYTHERDYCKAYYQ